MRILRGLAIAAAIVAAAWWLLWLTPSRGGLGDDTIRFGFWGDYQEYRMWRRIVEAFNEAHPGVRVRCECIPGTGAYADKLAAWMASDTAPEVMLLQDEPFGRYLAAGAGRTPVVLDLTAMISGQAYGKDLGVRGDDYWPTAWDSFGVRRPDGWHQYGLPVFGGNNLILYNRECFRRAGVELPDRTHIDRDWTVDEFLDLCRRLTLRDPADSAGRTVQWGFDRPRGWLYWLGFIYACDAQILNDDRSEFVFTGPEALRALELWDRLGREGLSPRGGELGQISQNAAFLTGRVAMICQGPWVMPFLNAAGMDYGVMFPPTSPTGKRGTRVTWDCVALAGRLADDPARRRAAYEFARFVASPQAAALIAESQRSIPAHRAGREAFVAGSDPRRAAKFIDAMAFSRVQPITLQWEQMDNALNNALGDLTAGAATPEQTLAAMAKAMINRELFAVRWPDGRRVDLKEAP